MANRDDDERRNPRRQDQWDDPRNQEGDYDWEWDRSFNRDNRRSYEGYYRQNFGQGYRQTHAVDRDYDRGGDDHQRGVSRAPDREPYGEYFDQGDSFDWDEVEARQIQERHFDRPYRQMEQNRGQQGGQSGQQPGQNRGMDQSRQRQEEWQQPGPYSGMGPSTYRRPDERIAEEVCERLTQHGQVDARNIDVQVTNGEVHLRGRVNRRMEKYIAEDVIEAISGVKDIHNELRVDERR